MLAFESVGGKVEMLIAASVRKTYSKKLKLQHAIL